METYQEFLARINAFETPQILMNDGDFTPSKSVPRKVRADNTYSDFYGDTTVFELNDESKRHIEKLTDRLFEIVPEVFSERLPADTYHITLHDLYNSPELEKIADKMFFGEIKLRQLLTQNPPETQTIRMKAKYLFNMVGTSVVLVFYPIDETEYHKLTVLYEVVEKVRKLDRPLTPHVTLGYYNINGFSAETTQKLKETVKELNENLCGFEVELSTQRLYYQKFISMKEYINIFPFS